MKPKKIINRMILKFYYFLFKKLTGIEKVLTDSNHPTQYIFPGKNTYGVFYDSYNKQQHLAWYIPYKCPPNVSICKDAINFSPSKSEDKICFFCYRELLKSSRFKSLAKIVLFVILRKENA